MPRYDDIYICPACGEAYSTWDDAKDCLTNHDPDEDMGWICDCGAVFRNVHQGLLHIYKCNRVEPSCINCNNYDPDLKIRHAPCERGNISKDMSACSKYRRIKVVL